MKRDEIVRPCDRHRNETVTLGKHVIPNIKKCENGFLNFIENLRIVALKLLEVTRFLSPNLSFCSHVKSNEANSNPTETHHSKRVSVMIRINEILFYQESALEVFYCQHTPALEPTLTRFTASQQRCSTITLLRCNLF